MWHCPHCLPFRAVAPPTSAGHHRAITPANPICPSRIRAERNNYYRLGRALAILHMSPPGAKLADFAVPAESDPGRPLDYDFRQGLCPLLTLMLMHVCVCLCVCVCVNIACAWAHIRQPHVCPAAAQAQRSSAACPSLHALLSRPVPSPATALSRCFFLHRPRLELYDRISQRIEEMLLGQVGAAAGQGGLLPAGGGVVVDATAGPSAPELAAPAPGPEGGGGGGLLQEAAMLLRAGIAPGSNMASKAIGEHCSL